MSAEHYVMANANRCTVHPQHVMVNQGRDEARYAEVYRCACGESALGVTDEDIYRRSPIPERRSMSGGTITRCPACGRLLIHGQQCVCQPDPYVCDCTTAGNTQIIGPLCQERIAHAWDLTTKHFPGRKR